MDVRVVGAGLATVFGFLAALHVFWALGGQAGTGAAIPEVDGRPSVVPSRTSTLLVALALTAAAVVVLARAGLAQRGAAPWIARVAAAVLGAVLVLRAIGDFRLVGFLKSVRSTRFASRDTWLYSPLSLLLGAGALWLAWR